MALRKYAVKHGRRWKSVLNHVWMGGAPYDDGGVLRGLRNTHGPSWLHAYRLPKAGAVDPAVGTGANTAGSGSEGGT